MLCSRASIDSYKRSKPLFLIQSVLKPRAVRITMFSNYSFKKDMEILKMMTTILKAHKKANNHLKVLNLAKKWTLPERRRRSM